MPRSHSSPDRHAGPCSNGDAAASDARTDGETRPDATSGDDDRPRVVVTGGAGFVGSHLVDRLLSAGHAVVSLDNYGSGRPSNLAHLSEEGAFTAIEHDVREPFPDVGTVDRVFHLASRASPVDFREHALAIAETNSVGTRNAAEFALEHDARLVVASTSEVYGDPEVNPQPETYNGNVDPRGPRAPYDEGKRFAEALASAYVRERGLDCRTVRIFNTYGPRMRADDGRVVPTFLEQALDDEDLTVHGDGSQTRSFCYVTDLVEALYRVGDGSPSRLRGEVVNLGSTREITIRTLAETVLDVVETDAELAFEPRPVDDPDLRRPDIDRARDLLGWEPEVSLETGLERTADFLRRSQSVDGPPA